MPYHAEGPAPTFIVARKVAFRETVALVDHQNTVQAGQISRLEYRFEVARQPHVRRSARVIMV